VKGVGLVAALWASARASCKFPGHMGERRFQIFVSYSPEDENLKDELLEHLAVLERFASVEVWTGDLIPLGTNRRSEIASMLDRADMTVLLVSSSWLAMFDKDNLLRELLEGRGSGGLLVPIILRDSMWRHHPLIKDIQVLPRDGQPIASQRNRDKSFEGVASEIARYIEERVGGTLPAQPVQRSHPNRAFFKAAASFVAAGASVGIAVELSGGSLIVIGAVGGLLLLLATAFGFITARHLLSASAGEGAAGLVSGKTLGLGAAAGGILAAFLWPPLVATGSVLGGAEVTAWLLGNHPPAYRNPAYRGPSSVALALPAIPDLPNLQVAANETSQGVKANDLPPESGQIKPALPPPLPIPSLSTQPSPTVQPSQSADAQPKAPTCKPTTGVCASTNDCCQLPCVGGRCIVDCKSRGEACNTALDCCGSMGCGDDGLCGGKNFEEQGDNCAVWGTRCSESIRCCKRYTCINDVCVNRQAP
jgi:hypothetical protein